MKQTITTLLFLAFSLFSNLTYAAIPITEASAKVEQTQVTSQTLIKPEKKTDDRNKAVALLLWFFFGVIGIHRFYLGYTTIGIIQIFTLCGLGIWWLIDGFRLLTGSLRPRKGNWKENL